MQYPPPGPPGGAPPLARPPMPGAPFGGQPPMGPSGAPGGMMPPGGIPGMQPGMPGGPRPGMPPPLGAPAGALPGQMQQLGLGPPSQGPPGAMRPPGAPFGGPPPAAAAGPQGQPMMPPPGGLKPPGPGSLAGMAPLQPYGAPAPPGPHGAPGYLPNGRAPSVGGMPPPMGGPPANGNLGMMPPPAAANGPMSAGQRPGPPSGFMPQGPPGMARPPGPPGPPGMMPPPGPPGPPGMMPPPGPPGMMPPPGPGMMPPQGPGGPGMPPPPTGMQHQQQPMGPPGAGPPGAFPQQQAMPARAPSQNRIDPTQIPRPLPTGPEPFVFETRVNNQHQVPPPANGNYIVRDRGNCSPRFIRATLNTVPATNDLLSTSAMPLALVVSPLALQDPADDPIQVVDMGEGGPIRCGRCKAYMNPYVRWASNGKSYTCNFCGCSNQTPDNYFCHIAPDGRRRDADERPELCQGTVEYVATPAYMVRPPMPPVHFFMIDVSQTAIASGATASACACIEQIVEVLQANERAMVGVATYDTAIHFYSLTPNQSQPQMLVMPDISDVYAPLSAPLVGRAVDVHETISAVLQAIPGYFAETSIRDSCGAAAVEAGIEVLKPTGGRVHAFIATLPNCGSRALKLRDQPAASERADKEKQAALLSADNTYKTLAASAADFQVAVDLFFVGQSYVDVATFADLPNMTGGSVYNYVPYNPMLDQDQLFNDLKWNVERPQGLEGIMRVRCSAGLDIDCYYGAFYKRATNPTDVDLPSIDCDKSVIAKVQHVDKLQANSDAYFQAALLYTSTEGQRRIRVHTLALPVSDSMSTVFKGADLDSQLAVLVRQTAIQVPGSALNVVKDTVISKAVSTLHAYRRYCATSSSSVQLILPEALKLLPLLTLGLLKSPGLRWDVKPDERATWLAAVAGATCSKLTPMLYGRLVPVHQLLQQQQGDGGELEWVPDGSLLSSEVFEAGGVYLYENGQEALVSIDKMAPAAVWQELAGVSSSEELSRMPTPVQLVAKDAPLSRLLQQLLVKVRQQRCSYMRLRLVRKGDSSEVAFLNSLVEDRSTAGMSYVEHLCHVHRLIQGKMG